MGDIVREKGRLGRRALGLVALLGGLGVAGVVTAPAASAAVYGQVTTSAYFSSLGNAANYAGAPPAGAQKQALANCRTYFPQTSSVSFATGAVTVGNPGYYGNVIWNCNS